MLLSQVILAFLFRIGSILIEVSSIPVRNVKLILMQNIIELTISTLSFFIIGYTLAYGNRTEPKWTIGLVLDTDNQDDIQTAINAWTKITTTTAIFTMMSAGRMHFLGYITITALISGIIAPLVINRIQTPETWIQHNKIMGYNVTYTDLGSNSQVHLLAGSAALLVTIFLGRRLMRLKDIDEASLPPGSETSLTIGYFLTIIGTFGLVLPYLPLYGTVRAAMNCGFAVIGGMSAVMIAELIVIRKGISYWTMERYLQGGLAAIVFISNGMYLHPQYMCLGLGAFSGLCFYAAQHLWFKTPFEDYCNVVPVHLFCGILSVFFTYPASVIMKHEENRSQYVWNIAVNVSLIGMYTACLAPVLLLLALLGVLRNHQCELENRRAMRLGQSQKSGRFFKRLLPPGPSPELLVPGNKGRQKEYQEQRLTEEVEVELKSDGKSALRKRRPVDDDAKASDEDNRSDWEEIVNFDSFERKKSLGVQKNLAAGPAGRMTVPLLFKKNWKLKTMMPDGGVGAGFLKKVKEGHGDENI